MKQWIAPIILAVALAGSTFYALAPGAAPSLMPGQQPEELISGFKRWPGTYQEETIKVEAGEALGEPDVTIDISALRPVFNPREIRVKLGQVVRLRIRGLDSGLADMPGVDEAIGLREFSGHGFQILGPYDVWLTGIRKDVVKEVTFRADVAGEFPIECVVFCSPQHYMMRGVFIVEK